MTTVSASDVDLAPAREVLDEMGDVSDGDLIPLLQGLQDAYGYLPPPVLMWASRQTGIPASRMYGVVTFYAQFHLEPHGRHTIRLCRGTACHVKGSRKLIEAAKGMLQIEEGATTEDLKFTLETVACLGTCFLSPAMMIDDNYFGNLTAQKVISIINAVE